MVWIAKPQDLPECLKFARAFHSSCIWSHIPFDEESASATILGAMQSGRVFLSETGFLGAIMAPLLFNAGHKVAYELFWYAERDGLNLIKAYEKWAEEAGAIPLMVCLSDENEERMTRLYKRRGYTPSERYFVKV